MVVFYRSNLRVSKNSICIMPFYDYHCKQRIFCQNLQLSFWILNFFFFFVTLYDVIKKSRLNENWWGDDFILLRQSTNFFLLYMHVKKVKKKKKFPLFCNSVKVWIATNVRSVWKDNTPNSFRSLPRRLGL